MRSRVIRLFWMAFLGLGSVAAWGEEPQKSARTFPYPGSASVGIEGSVAGTDQGDKAVGGITLKGSSYALDSKGRLGLLLGPDVTRISANAQGPGIVLAKSQSYAVDLGFTENSSLSDKITGVLLRSSLSGNQIGLEYKIADVDFLANIPRKGEKASGHLILSSGLAGRFDLLSISGGLLSLRLGRFMAELQAKVGGGALVDRQEGALKPLLGPQGGLRIEAEKTVADNISIAATLSGDVLKNFVSSVDWVLTGRGAADVQFYLGPVKFSAGPDASVATYLIKSAPDAPASQTVFAAGGHVGIDYIDWKAGR